MKNSDFSHYKASASNWLDLIRCGAVNGASQLIGWLREDVLHGHLTLTDIGTSEKELEELRVKCHKASAINWLGSLRTRTNKVQIIGFIREDVRKGGFALVDIGTSEEELRVTA